QHRALAAKQPQYLLVLARIGVEQFDGDLAADADLLRAIQRADRARRDPLLERVALRDGAPEVRIRDEAHPARAAKPRVVRELLATAGTLHVRLIISLYGARYRPTPISR